MYVTVCNLHHHQRNHHSTKETILFCSVRNRMQPTRNQHPAKEIKLFCIIRNNYHLRNPHAAKEIPLFCTVYNYVQPTSSSKESSSSSSSCDWLLRNMTFCRTLATSDLRASLYLHTFQVETFFINDQRSRINDQQIFIISHGETISRTC
jgi:hypothetical protein